MDKAAVGSDGLLYLEKKLIFSDSLHRLDEIRRDGVGQSVSLLYFLLQTENRSSAMRLDGDDKEHWIRFNQPQAILTSK